MSALFNFQSLLLVILLIICTSTYAHATFPKIMDRNREGVFGIFWKCARIGERLSPYISVCCVVMAVLCVGLIICEHLSLLNMVITWSPSWPGAVIVPLRKGWKSKKRGDRLKGSSLGTAVMYMNVIAADLKAAPGLDLFVAAKPMPPCEVFVEPLETPFSSGGMRSGGSGLG